MPRPKAEDGGCLLVSLELQYCKWLYVDHGTGL